MAAYGGVNLFGIAVTMSTADHPREKQINSYFGLSGLETLDGGSRGRVTSVGGVLVGRTPAELAQAEATFRTYSDGLTRDLSDSLGTTWSNVRLELFQPLGRIRQSPQGMFFRSYRAQFLHLE